MANVSHIKLPDGTVLDLPSGGGGGGTKNVWYATCPTAANTGDKVVTTSSADFSLTAGNILIIKFTYSTKASTNYLQVDSLTKKLVKTIGGQSYGRYFWNDNEAVPFVYDGTYFWLIKGATATTTYYGLTKLNGTVTSTSNSEAAAAGAVKIAYDLAASKSEVVANDTTGTSGGSLSSIKINGTSYTISGGGGGGGAGLNIPLDYSYSALVALSGDTVYLIQGTTISKSSIESTLQAGGAINFTFFNFGMFDGEATLIGYEEYSDGFGTHQRGLAVLTNGSSTKTYIVEFVWDYQDNIQNLVFTALSGGGSAFGVSTPVAYLDYNNGVVQNTTIDSGLLIAIGDTNPVAASNFVLECSYGNTVAISAMAYAIVDNYSNRYNSFDAYIQSNPQVQDQCSLVVWYVTTGNMIWKTTIPLTVNDITSVSVELGADQYGQAISTQANFVGD